MSNGIIGGSPCGACRELIMQLDKDSKNIEILINKDTENEKLELIFLETNKTLIVQKSELFSSGKIIKLADKGMQVNSNNSKAWVEYFSNLEALNKKVIPRKRALCKFKLKPDIYKCKVWARK